MIETSLYFIRIDSITILVSQLFNAEGLLLNYEDFLSRYNITNNTREFAIFFDAIPSGTLLLFRGVARPYPLDLSSLDPTDSPKGNKCFSLLPRNSRSIRALFQRDIVSVLMSQVTKTHRSLISVGQKVWLLPHKYLLVNKIEEVSYRMIHKCYPANHDMTHGRLSRCVALTDVSRAR